MARMSEIALSAPSNHLLRIKTTTLLAISQTMFSILKRILEFHIQFATAFTYLHMLSQSYRQTILLSYNHILSLLLRDMEEGIGKK